ncbi:hypothetical protein FRC20_001714 [Serendipita sp. 405]|nr:hypothetical protein FRC20_001714 [Serendipita sp. 405]
MQTKHRTTALVRQDWHTELGVRAFRNRLALIRSVCHSWKEFSDLKRIQYRFVDIWDLVLGQRATIEQVLCAQRIGGQNPYSIMPRNMQKPYFPSEKTDVVALIQQVPAELIAAAMTNRRFTAEIASTIGARMSNFILHEHPEAFPNLKSLQIDLSYWFWPGPPLCVLGKVSAGFKDMVYLELNMGSNFAFMSTDILDLPLLESLLIQAIHGLSNTPFEKWKLPSLCHLELRKLKDFQEMKRLLKGLANFGAKLESLSVGVILEDIEDFSCISSIWSDCPNLRHLGIPSILVLPMPPPPHHPLEMLLNTDSKTLAYLVSFGWCTIPYPETLLDFCLAASNLKAIQDVHSWRASVYGHFTHPQDSDNSPNGAVTFSMAVEYRGANLMVEAAHALSGGRIRFEDREGYLFEETRG